MKKQVLIIAVVLASIMLSSCSNMLSFNYDEKMIFVLYLSSLLGNGSASETESPSLVVLNIRNNMEVKTGFMIGTANDNVSVDRVEVSTDGGSYVSASGTTSWTFKLPSGASTWKRGSRHTINVRSVDTDGNYSTITTITVLKGVNRDTNGDGYEDLIVGARRSDPSYSHAYIFLSAGNNGIASRDLSGSGSADTVLKGASASSYFARSVALGDVNGDGYSDAVVGEYGYNSEQGRAYIFHSDGSSGIASQDLSTSGSADTVLTGDNTGDSFGWAVTLGDVNGDGYSDALISAGEYNSRQGRAYIFHSAGSSGIASQDLSGSGSADTVLEGENTGDTFGFSVAFGDVNGDGYLDAILGACFYNSNQGRVYIFHSTGSSGIASQDLSGSGSAGAVLTGESSNNYFGWSVALGDVNGDSYADALVGSGASNKSYIFHSAGSSGISSQDLSGSGFATTVLTGETSGVYFGRSVALGDVNGDGYSDALIGAQSYNSDQGRAYIFLSTGSSGIISQDLSGSGSSGAVMTGETGNSFGHSVVLGDVNGDGYSDAIVGGTGETSSQEGWAYIFHSQGTSGIANTSAGSADTTLRGETVNDRFGTNMAFNLYPHIFSSDTNVL